MLIPKQQITFLGFILCSITMTVRLTPQKCDEIVKLCEEILHASRITIRKFSKLVGKLVAASPGVQYAVLYTRPLEKIKETELKTHQGKFNAYMNIPVTCQFWLNWWISNIHTSFKPINIKPPDVVIYTDASLKQWGAYDKTHNQKTNGFWSVEEQSNHINILELKACQFGIMAFCKNMHNIHVRVFMDNTTSCYYLENYGGKYTELNKLAQDIWMWCIDHKIHLSACHVAGSSNCTADKLSRDGNDDLEWSISKNIFDKLYARFPMLQIDLFASRLNSKLPLYISRYPEKDSYAVDAFTISWSSDNYYIFAPFSLTARILKKIEDDQTEMALIILPLWPGQVWWPILTNMIIGNCLILPSSQQILTLPHRPERKHPLKKMKLVAFPISGKHWRSKEYRDRQQTSSSRLGDKEHGNNTAHILSNGFLSVKGKIIPLIHL